MLIKRGLYFVFLAATQEFTTGMHKITYRYQPAFDKLLFSVINSAMLDNQ